MSEVLSEHTDLMKEWDYAKNDELGLDPSFITSDSNIKAWWKCSFGHEWMDSVSKRVSGKGCRFCNMRKAKAQNNILESVNPELSKEWHPTKNGDLTPADVSAGSGLIVWWVCNLGHEWQAQINSRNRGVGCPYCNSKRAIKGFNDFGTRYPDLVKEWHPTKNNGLTPYDFTFGSGKKVWWLCNNGHEYEAAINNRTKGEGCPICASARRTSFPEQAVYYYIKKAFPDAISRYKDIFDNGREVDVYIPSIQTAIEYDGLAYHNENTLKKDNEKYNECKNKGIRLIRIVETSPSSQYTIQDYKLEIPNGKRKYLDAVISQLCDYLGFHMDVNTSNDRMEIMQYLVRRDKSLVSEFPDVAAEWDYDYNAPQVPEHFDPYSNERVGWVCKKCGHKWVTSIASRTSKGGTGCPICARRTISEKLVANRINEQGSLYDSYPELMKEWDFERNEIDPHDVSPGSNKRANWICKTCGYRWKTRIASRTKLDRGCPLCTNQVIVAGVNDLLTRDPELASELDCEKNGFGPESIAPFTNRKVWWKCKVCGNSWLAAPSNRSQNHGCPFCSGRVPKPGINDLKTLFPSIAKEWNYEKNGDLLPEQFTPYTKKKAWWKCSKCGYEWQSKIWNRTRDGSGCPKCFLANKRAEKSKPIEGQIEFDF